MIRTLCLLAVLAATSATAQEVRPADADRLARTDALLGASLRWAFASGAPGDVAVLVEALSGAEEGFAPEGDWNCRTMKLGGNLPLVVYGNFRCRITADGPDRWRLEKLTGSQFTAGTLTLREDGILYLGTGYVEGGPATDYAGLPPGDQTPVEPGQTTADVGWFEQMGPNRARLLLPDPILESDFDILYLTR